MKTIITSFFRKKSIYIYIILYTIIFTTAFLLYAFYDYYNTLINGFYVENSYFLVTSNKDISTELSNEVIKEFEVGTLYIPQDIQKPLTFIDNQEESNFNDTDWQSFINLDFNGILIFNSKNNSNNEIDISFPKYCESFYQDIDININRSVQIKIKDNYYTFKIKEYSFKDCYQINVSNDIFSEIFKYSEIYIYKINPTLKKSYKQINNNIKKTCENQNLCNYEFYEYNNYNQLENEQMLNTLKKAIAYFGLVFIAIFIILAINVTNDTKKEIRIYEILGFKKQIIKMILFFEQFIINICTLLLSYLLYLIGIIILNNIYELNLKVISMYNFLPIELILIILLFVLCILYKTNCEKLN